ncbi:MAG: FCD domain-containing protein [Paracoccus sp. (in: a-proteobacteria)]|nr:FCD domain-containing protein [Paracoccus sp. (in: a-proteobacteria)]
MLGDVICRESGRLPTEREMAEQLGMGRRAIRRALEVLEAEGMIWRRQGSGTFLGPKPAEAGGPVSPDDEPDLSSSPLNVLQIIEARLILEPTLAKLAATRAGPQHVQRMRAYNDAISSAEDTDEADLWDSAFHREIARAAGNPFALKLFDNLDMWRHDPGLRQHRLHVRRGLEASARVARTELTVSHETIVDAIAESRSSDAAVAMRAHLGDLQNRFLNHATKETIAHDV